MSIKDNDNRAKIFETFIARVGSRLPLLWQCRTFWEGDRRVEVFYRGEHAAAFYYNDVCDDVVRELDKLDRLIDELSGVQNG